MMKRLTILALLSIFGIATFGYCQSHEEILESLNAHLHQPNNTQTDLLPLTQILNAESRLVLDVLYEFDDDPDPGVRKRVLELIANKGSLSSNTKIRQEVVEKIAGKLGQVAYKDWPEYHLLNMGFGDDDFTPNAQKLISQWIDKEKYDKYRSKLIKIIGVANLQNQIPYLEELINNSEYKPGHRNAAWFARLALARMGYKEHIDYCVSEIRIWIEGHEYAPYIVEDALYIRQFESVQILKDILLDESKSRLVGEVIYPSDQQYHIMGELEKILIGFPSKESFKKTYPGEAPIELRTLPDPIAHFETARQWMREQTDFKIRR